MDENAGGHREEEQAGGHRDEEGTRLPVEWQYCSCLLVQLLQLLVGQVLQRRRLFEVIIFRRLSALRKCFALISEWENVGGITYLLPIGLGLGEHNPIDVQIVDGATNGVDVQLAGTQRNRLALAAGAGSTPALNRIPPVLRLAGRIAHGKRRGDRGRGRRGGADCAGCGGRAGAGATGGGGGDRAQGTCCG